MAVETDILPPRYRGPERIGRGAMGEIYRATDSVLGRVVAIKLLAERHARNEAVRQRFTREALAAARVSGEPNTVTIFDVGEHDERPLIVMEYLGGGSLGDLLRKDGPQPLEQVFRWLEQAGRALDAAHREGVVHRDVKPANLMLDREGNVHVADFGIASAAGLDSLTATGTVLGTAGYLPPEQAVGERATPASDRYALAVVAFELLAGRRPYEADSPTAEASAHVHGRIPSISAATGLPYGFDPVFRKALAKRPADRYESCAEFVRALRAVPADVAGAPTEARPVIPPRRRWLAWPVLPALLAFAVVAGALLAYELTREQGGGAAQGRGTVTVRGRTRTRTVIVTTPASPSIASPSRGRGAGSAAEAHRLNDKAFKAMAKGDYETALKLLPPAVERLRGAGPEDLYEGYANFNLGYTLLQLDRCEEAIPFLEHAQELEPDRSEPGDALARAQECSSR